MLSAYFGDGQFFVSEGGIELELSIENFIDILPARFQENTSNIFNFNFKEE